jgi:chromosome segregation ATPase
MKLSIFLYLILRRSKMKKEFELLLQFDENIKILKENQKILQDKTKYENLKELKTSYENHKAEYSVLVEKSKKTTELCENISKEIECIEEELNSKEDILLNHCGSDIHKIKNTENIISSLKEKVNILNEKLDIELSKESKFNKEIKVVLIN